MTRTLAGSSAITPDLPSTQVGSSDSNVSSMNTSATVMDTSSYPPEDPVLSANPYTYLSSITFHQSFMCPRTESRVSYSDCGNKEGPLLIYVAPSGCSRWTGVFLDGYAREKGIRLVTPDRPGQGITPRVKLESRIEVAHKQMLSLLEHLCVKKVAFMTHSAGVYFLIPVLTSLLATTSSSLPQLMPRIFVTSPWVPTSISGNIYFPLIPSVLVRNGYIFLPKLLPVISNIGISGRIVKNGCTYMLGMSGFKVSPSDSSINSNAAGVEVQSAIKPKAPSHRFRLPNLRRVGEPAILTADIHPPFKSSLDAKLRSAAMEQWVTKNIPPSIYSDPACEFGTNLLFKYMFAEGMWGISQEHLLCLGKASDGGKARLTERLVDGWGEVGKLWVERAGITSRDSGEVVPDYLTVVIYWASGDGMVPFKGRVWLDDLISSKYGLKLIRHELGATSAHETPVLSEEVMGDIFDWVKANCR